MMTGDLGLTWQTRGATRGARHVPAIIGVCCAHADTCSRMGAREDSATASSAHGGVWKLWWGRFSWRTTDRRFWSRMVVPLSWIEAWKALIWASKAATAIDAWATDSGGEIGTWRHVASLMATHPPPNDRSAKEDSNGGAILRFGSPEDRVLKCECGSGAWWRVGSPSENSSGAWECVVALMTTIFQGFVDWATIYPMVEVVAWLEAWKLEFRGSPCLAELGC